MSVQGKLQVVGVLSPLAIHYVKTNIVAARIKTLRGNPIIVVPKPSSDEFIELVGGALILYAGTQVLTETDDNLAVRYGTGTGAVASQTIEATGFMSSASDVVTTVLPGLGMIVPLSVCLGLPLLLHNTGDGEYAGNAANDALLIAQIAYRVHKVAP